MKPVAVVKSYHVSLGSSNPGKLYVLDQIQRRLAQEARLISSFVERQVFTTGKLDKLAGTLKFRNIPQFNWATSLYTHVAGQWKSWIENRRNDYNALVFRYALDHKLEDRLRHELFMTGKMKLWLVPLGKGPKAVGDVTFTEQGRRLARTLWKVAVHGVRKPTFEHVPVFLNQRCAALVTRTHSRDGIFSHWREVKVPASDPTWNDWPRLPLDQAIVDERTRLPKSKNTGEETESSNVQPSNDSAGLTSTKPDHTAEAQVLVSRRKAVASVVMNLPVAVYDHAKNAPGTLSQSVALLPPRDGKPGREGWILSLAKTSQADQWADPSPEAFRLKTLGIDLGLNTLIATSEGDLVEPGWKAWIETLDEKLVKLCSGRQRRGLPVRCKAYDRLVAKLRNTLVTRIGQALKPLIENHRPEVVVMEKLSFQGANLSRRLNRLISNFGKGSLDKWFRDHARIYGYRVEFVNPAFTSQECSSCGYIDSRNRNGAVFKCLCCGLTAHADQQASHNVRERFTRSTARPAGGVPSPWDSLVPDGDVRRGRIEPWMRPGHVFAKLFHRWWTQEVCSPQGRFGTADGTPVQESVMTLLSTLVASPSWKKYGNSEWLACPITR